MEQLPLDLALAPRFGREDFLVAASNAAAAALIDRWPDWPDRVLLLTGPEGAGKSHLAAIWAARTGARALGAADLATADLPSLADRPLLIEDADRSGVGEAPLFHLLNLARGGATGVLLTARTEPGAWGLRTPDLVSRLRLAPGVPIEAPDEALVRAVLVKLFADRQLLVDESVVGYLAGRLDRSLGAARAAVDALDRTALALNRRVTRPMAAKIVDRLARDEASARESD